MRRRRGNSRFNQAAILTTSALVDINESSITQSGGVVTSLTNQGTGGSGYDLDTVVGTGANLKPHPSGSCLLFGASGDAASTPDSAAASITGDIDLRAQISFDDWTPGANSAILSKYRLATDGRSFLFKMSSANRLELTISSDGNATTTDYTATAATSFTDGELGWVRVALDVDNGSSDSAATFYTSTDGETWTQLGAVVNSGSTESIFDSTTRVNVGAYNNEATNNWRGYVKRAQIYNGIDGTLAVDFNPTDYSSGTTFASSTTSETWTLNGNSFIQNTGKTVVHSIGSVGIETSAGQSISSPGTVFVVGRVSNTPSTNAYFFDARSDGNARWATYSRNSQSDRFTTFQGSADLTLSEAFDNLPHVFTSSFNGDATTKLTVSGVGTATGDSGSDNYDYGTVFSDFNGSNTLRGYMGRLLVFNRALNETEISIMQDYLEAQYGL